MSKSRKKSLWSPICCVGPGSHKQWKRMYNKAYRTNYKRAIHHYLKGEVDWYDIGYVYKQHYADMWSSPSDGYRRVELLNEDEYNNKKLYRYYKSYNDYVIQFKKSYVYK